MIYLDTNVLIYAIENHPKYGDRCKKVLEDLMREKIKAAASVLSTQTAQAVLYQMGLLRSINS